MDLYLTPEDNKEFQKILTELEAEKALLTKKLAEVAAFGGSFPAGIPEYAAIENQIGIIDSQINGIIKTLDLHQIVTAEKIDEDKINNYSQIVLKDQKSGEEKEYYLIDMNLAKTKEIPKDLVVITPLSPLGKALIGKNKNEVFTVEIPKGTMEYQVKRIEKKFYENRV